MRVTLFGAGVIAAAVGLAIPVLGQSAPPGQPPLEQPSPGQPPLGLPYAGLQTRTVAALSDQQVADLRAGRGMGFARAAELNGYPGPMHVLELAEPLRLSAEQVARTRMLFESMRGEAVPLGEHLIHQEAELNALFAGRTITPVSLDGVTRAIGETQAVLRAVHLRYHLAMMEVLSADQVRDYGILRGHGAAGPHQGPGGHGGQHHHRP